MMELSWHAAAAEALPKLNSGAFLTTAANGSVNTMTIGWGGIGYAWQKPVFTALVRKSRFTYELLEQSREFTVSMPAGGMAQALNLCGSKSGRDMDKLAAAGLKTAPSLQIATPRLDIAGIHFECRVLNQHDMDESLLDAKVKQSFYGDNDFHVFYYGEIVACCRQE